MRKWETGEIERPDFPWGDRIERGEDMGEDMGEHMGEERARIMESEAGKG